MNRFSSLPRGARFAWGTIFVVALMLAFANTGYAESGDASTSGSSGAFVLIAALAAMVVLGSPLFVIIGVLVGLCFFLWGEGYEIGPCTNLTDNVCMYDVIPAQMGELAKKPVLLAIPFFVVSGAIMSAGDIANRLIRLARAFVGWLPGGLAVATVGGCIFFAAISGSSPVTVIAIGSIMYPALVKAKYPERFSMGLVASAGSLGILIPPSIPMLVFAIVAGGSAPVDVGELFMAGVIPGALIGGLLALYSVFVAGAKVEERDRFSWGEAWYALKHGFWAVMLPIFILGGIYTGVFTATEAAAISVVYAVIVELFIHRQLRFDQLPKVLADSAVMMGTILIIMALAFGLNAFLVEKRVPELAVDLLLESELSPVQFLLAINLLLLIVGALMESISAILVIAPLLAPVALELGIDPVHLGVIFIVNLEIGYLTPPIGINLFVASAAFEKPMGEVIRSVVPFILLMFVGLGIVTYVPSTSMGLVNILMRDKPFYHPLPDADRRADDGQSSGALVGGAEGSEQQEQSSQMMVNITNVTTQLQSLCFLAEDVLDDDSVAADARVQAWKAGFEDEGITEPKVLELAGKAIEKAGTAEAYDDLKAEASTILKMDWKCEALTTLLGPTGSPTDEAADADSAEDEAEPEDDQADEAADGSEG